MPAIATCPSCHEDIKLRGKVTLGQAVDCPYCEAELEVIYLDPVELDWADEPYDAWDEEEWEHARGNRL
jgi:alpha-aminoadipate carrier protein LysW